VYGLVRRWSVRTMLSLSMAALQRLQQGVCDRLHAAGRPAWRRHQGVPCDSALEVAQKTLYQGVRGLILDSDEGNNGQACWPHPWRKRHADVADAFRQRRSDGSAAKLRKYGLGGCRKDQPAQGPQLHDSVRPPDGRSGAFRPSWQEFLGLWGIC
jgi:hypothetical protein